MGTLYIGIIIKNVKKEKGHADGNTNTPCFNIIF